MKHGMARLLGFFGVARSNDEDAPPEARAVMSLSRFRGGSVRELGDEPIRVMETCVDPETYAAIYNAGFEDAVAMELTEDPENAHEWLEGRLARERYDVLRKYAKSAEERGDIGKSAGGIEAWDWLRVAAESEIESGPVDPIPLELEPFQRVLREVAHRSRVYGGGIGDAYSNVHWMLETAFRHYQKIED